MVSLQNILQTASFFEVTLLTYSVCTHKNIKARMTRFEKGEEFGDKKENSNGLTDRNVPVKGQDPIII
jgi:hypothetical protein